MQRSQRPHQQDQKRFVNPASLIPASPTTPHPASFVPRLKSTSSHPRSLRCLSCGEIPYGEWFRFRNNELSCPQCHQSYRSTRALETVAEYPDTESVRSAANRPSPVSKHEPVVTTPASPEAAKKKGHNFGRVGTLKCATCREAGKKCDYDDPDESCQRCRRLDKDCGSKHLTIDGPRLKRKRPGRKGSATPAAETPAATPGPDRWDPNNENILALLMARTGLDDPRKILEIVVEQVSAAIGQQLRVEVLSTGNATEQKPLIDIEMPQQSPPAWLNPASKAETDPRYSQHEPQWTMGAEPKSRNDDIMTVAPSTSQPTAFDLTYLGNFPNDISASMLDPVPTVAEPQSSQSTMPYPDSMDDTEPFDPSLLAPFPPPSPRRPLSLNTNNTIIGPSYPGIIRQSGSPHLYPPNHNSASDSEWGGDLTRFDTFINQAQAQNVPHWAPVVQPREPSIGENLF